MTARGRTLLHRGLRVAAGALLLGLAACESPIDETWLHVASFKDGESSVSAVDTGLGTGKTRMVTAELENSSAVLGGTSGVAIIVQRAHVSYTGLGVPLPSYDYPVALYLAGGAEGKATTGSVAVPIAPAHLKEWLRTSSGVPAPPFSVSAMVTFSAVTEEGRDLETSAGLSILFTNSTSN